MLLTPLLTVVLAFLLLDVLFPFPWAALERPSAVEVVDAEGRPLRFFLAADDRWRVPVRLEELPAELTAAVIASEDQRFGRHPGVDPLAVLRAAWGNLRAGRVVSGASTLPMQLARMAEPRRRTLGAKVIESFRALQLAWHLDKKEVLERYLQLAPYGGNLEGVRAASRFYFGKEPAALSTGEIALLVALPRSPNGYDPVRHPEAARQARDRVLGQLAQRGVITPEAAAIGRQRPLPTGLQSLPFEAPHFSRWAAGWAADRVPGKDRVVTSLRLPTQRAVEHQVRRWIGELRARGMANAAVVAIENEPRAVRAWVGSAGFGEDAFDGQVDGVLARRSPGSTLKPFLYALAFDQGRLIPDTWLLDLPRDYAGYVPENYDGVYHGRVTARDALVRSLNAPAVALLARLGLPHFLEHLQRGGATSLDAPAGRYGLPLVLGAGEVTLVELTQLYAHLAEEGVAKPLRRLGGGGSAAPGAGEAWLSREAALRLTEILTGLERPDLPASWQLAPDAPRVAWKTGTSYGHRDAWAMGYTESWTVGVWVGRFDGGPVEGISGSRDAAPLLFDVLRAMDPGGRAPAAPPGLPAPLLTVCATSHELPTRWCPRTVAVPYLPGRTRLGSCSWHRRVFVDRESGRLLTGDCLARDDRHPEPRVVNLPPAELTAWWRARGQTGPGMAEASLPPVDTTCRGPGTPGEAPRIVSPDPATPYRLRGSAPRSYQRLALVARGQGTLYWYLNGVLVARAEPQDTRFVALTPGVHRMAVVDGAGRVDRVSFRVEGGAG